MTPGLADAIKNYPQMREDYLAEFAKRQEALAQKAEVPRQGVTLQDDPPVTEPPEARDNTEKVATKPIINLKEDRIANIKANKPAGFNIDENPAADGTAPFYRDHKRGVEAVSTYEDIIEREAKKQGVNPDLVKSIMYMENADGHKYGLNDMADKIGISKSVMPMNIRPDIWGELGITRHQAEKPEENIRASITLIRRIQDRIDNPTPEKIGALWNNISREKINDIGARVGAIYRGRDWERR